MLILQETECGDKRLLKFVTGEVVIEMKKDIDNIPFRREVAEHGGTKDSVLYKYLPFIMGAVIGVISIVMGLIPNGIRQFTGLTVIGNHVGYLLGALVVAWVYHEKWLKGFLLSSCMIVIANTVYYAFIFAFSFFDLFGGQTESYMSNLYGLLTWCVIGVVVGLLAATAVWMARKAKSRILHYGIFGVSYVGLLGVIYLYQVQFVLTLYRYSAFDSPVSVRQFVGGIFEVVLAVVLTTVVLGIGLRERIRMRTCQSTNLG